MYVYIYVCSPPCFLACALLQVIDCELVRDVMPPHPPISSISNNNSSTG